MSKKPPIRTCKHPVRARAPEGRREPAQRSATPRCCPLLVARPSLSAAPGLDPPTFTASPMSPLSLASAGPPGRSSRSSAATGRLASCPTTRSGTASEQPGRLDVIALMDALGIDTAILAGFDPRARPAFVVAGAVAGPLPGRGLRLSGLLIPSEAASHAPLLLAGRQNLPGGTSSTSPPTAARLVTSNPGASSASSSGGLAPPKWCFDDVAFARSAAAFDNPDHVAVVIDPIGVAAGSAGAVGEPQDDDLELAAPPFFQRPPSPPSPGGIRQRRAAPGRQR